MFHIEIEGKGGWIIGGGGGAKGMLAPLPNYCGGGGLPPSPLPPTPMKKLTYPEIANKNSCKLIYKIFSEKRQGTFIGTGAFINKVCPSKFSVKISCSLNGF